ncbi:MAG: M15 family metallopeptidase [Bacteroidota bacterium]
MNFSLPRLFAIILIFGCYIGCQTTGNNENDSNEEQKDTTKKVLVKPPSKEDSLVASTADPLTMEKDDSTKKPSAQEGETEFSIDYLMGKFDPKKHPDFALIAPEYCSRQGMYLRKEVYESYKKMHAAALKEGIRLTIISDTRAFNRQKQIWEGKWNGSRLVGGKDLSKTIPDPKERALKILEFSSMPGTSRHHWGTDLDINNLENSYFESGRGKQEYDWLVVNAASYGFCQPYTEKEVSGRTGYEEEKWHWSYTPTSTILTKAYVEKINEDMIGGFAGSESAKIIGVIEKYVLGIHPDCR